MEIQNDFKELLALLNASNAEYVIVGAHALAFHGVPRYTGDLDILVRPEAANAQAVLAVLAEFGFSFPNLTAEDFQTPNMVIQLGVPPVRIDIITSLSGVSWDEVEEGKEAGSFGDVPVRYLGRDQLIANKRATGRTQDMADLESLGLE
jgi:hypothetical protein